MAVRGRNIAKRAKAAKRVKPMRNPQSPANQSARLKSRKAKSGERLADKGKSGTAALKDLLRAAEDRQTVTAELLQVVSNSMADSAPVFESILDSCEKLLQFTSAAILLVDGNKQIIQLQAARGSGAAENLC